MEERKTRSKIANLESLTLGNCNITLTLDTRYKDENEKYHVSIRFTVNTARYYFHLGRKYTSEEWDGICKSDGRGRGGNQSQNYIDRTKLVELYNQYVDLARDMSNKGTLKSIDNIRAVLTGRISTYGNVEEAALPYTNTFIGLWNEVNVRNGYNVDVDMIKAWVAYMKEMRYAQTTIGIYLRAIRVVFKACISSGYMREKDYPFSATDSTKVKISSGSSRRSEFLTVDQMTELYEFYTDFMII